MRVRESAEHWLRKAVRNAPKPLPKGCFPQLLAKAESEGYERAILNDVVDEWLNYGYCLVTDHVSNDIEILPAGESVFGGSFFRAL